MTGAPVRAGVRRYVYSTAAFTHVRKEVSKVSREPRSVVHGKETGTPLTLCGESAETWYKFYDVPFESASAERCSSCLTFLEVRFLEEQRGRELSRRVEPPWPA